MTITRGPNVLQMLSYYWHVVSGRVYNPVLESENYRVPVTHRYSEIYANALDRQWVNRVVSAIDIEADECFNKTERLRDVYERILKRVEQLRIRKQ